MRPSLSLALLVLLPPTLLAQPPQGLLVRTISLADEVRSLAVSPDGLRLITGGSDVVRVCDATMGKELLTMRGHTGSITSVACSPDGKNVASCGGGTLQVWDTATGRVRFSFRQAAIPGVQEAGPCSTRFSPDAKFLAAGCPDGSVRLLDAATGKELIHLRGHTRAVRQVAFSPDGKTLASGSRNSP